MCRPGPVWYSPPGTGLASRMRDSFDHWREEKFGDERTSLPGSDFEGGEGAGRREEEEDILPMYQDRSCLEEYVVIEMYDPESVDRRESLNRLCSLSDEELNSACGSTLDSHDDLRINEWRCDYSSCGRVFNTRRDLKYVFEFPLKQSIAPNYILISEIVSIGNIISSHSNA